MSNFPTRIGRFRSASLRRVKDTFRSAVNLSQPSGQLHAMKIFFERRATKRFRVELPITVRWTNGSAFGEAHTESQNISSRGVYFLLPEEVKSGSAVEIVLTLPHENTLAGPLRVRCQGRVLRTEIKKLDGVGTVAQIKCYEFLRGNENTA
jgi:hypothetical protein